MEAAVIVEACLYAWGRGADTSQVIGSEAIVGNATVADWTEGGSENEDRELDAATAAAKANASIS